MNTVRTLKPQSIVESVYTQVREQVLSGRIAPGTPMRQDEIAARLGVSKIPLREAFSRLEREGLLVLRPRRGYAVASFEIEEIVEIFDLRAIVEEHAARLAARNRTEADIGRVKEIAGAMERLAPQAAGYYDQWCGLNRRFHDAMVEASHAAHVIKTAVQLRNVVEPYIRMESAMTGVEAVAEDEHRRIVAALEAGDEDAAGALSAAHCHHTRDRLVEGLRRLQEREQAKA
ncbi:GntR family transcriptional regulator [Ramlibacter sp. G-1-2-2]|uniref:GntR family transcriptional regulator n=1 Tax=Ramlibacter agri TaxID=2728837 RepID=A0A848HEF3_9BURK|nr:GntR family transcriptional regulator [Ramlibacter agri]NML47860.1 GntR family transcriptional regulator [Ramlibacter agri]